MRMLVDRSDFGESRGHSTILQNLMIKTRITERNIRIPQIPRYLDAQTSNRKKKYIFSIDSTHSRFHYAIPQEVLYSTKSCEKNKSIQLVRDESVIRRTPNEELDAEHKLFAAFISENWWFGVVVVATIQMEWTYCLFQIRYIYFGLCGRQAGEYIFPITHINQISLSRTLPLCTVAFWLDYILWVGVSAVRWY